MRDNNFLQLHISYFGFERKLQQQLESHFFKNIRLLKKSGVFNNISGNIDSPGVNIHIYFFSCPSKINAQMFEKSNAVSARVLCIGQYNDFEELLSCIQAGSYGCISIMNVFEEIIPAIQSVSQNKIYVSSSLAPAVIKYFKNNKDHYSNLFTTRENKLIQLLTEGALYKEIAWKLNISQNTVRSHVRNIYSKMKVHSKTQLTQKILTAILHFHLFISY